MVNNMNNNLGDDGDDDARAYFRGRRIPSPGRRDDRLRKALAEVARIAEEELAPQQQAAVEAMVPQHGPDDFEQKYGPRRLLHERLHLPNQYDVLRKVREERILRRGRKVIRVPPPPPPVAPPPNTVPSLPAAGGGTPMEVANDELEEAEIDQDQLEQHELFAHVDAEILQAAEILRALSPLIGARQVEVQDNQASPSQASENQDDAGNVDDHGAPEQQIAEAPVNNPAVDFPDPELMKLIADLRADPAMHRPEYRKNPTLGSRTPGETDSAFRPHLGDIVSRVRPLPDGTFLEYYTSEISRAAPLQAGDRVVRFFYDNTTDLNNMKVYADLHICIGYQGGQEPRFLYFGKSDDTGPMFRAG